jgi:hypothetical protein
VFISASHADARLADEIRKVLENHGFETAPTKASLALGEKWRETVIDELGRCEALVTIVSPNWAERSRSSGQSFEIDSFVRQSLRSSTRKPIIPLVLPGGESALRHSRLADYQSVFVDSSKSIDLQLGSVIGRLRDLFA